MNLHHRFLPEFFGDVETAAAWYEEQNPAAADRFWLLVESTLDRVGDSPLSNPFVDSPTRVAIVGEFPGSGSV